MARNDQSHASRSAWPTGPGCDLQPKPYSSPVARFVGVIRIWMERARRRRGLRELAERDNYLLLDVGLTREDAMREAAKPFWKR